MKRKLFFTLPAILAMALTLVMVSSGFAANDGIQGRDNGSLLAVNGQTFQMLMVTTDKGATFSTEIVVGQTNSSRGPSSAVVFINAQTAQDTSPIGHLGSGAQLVTDQPLAGVASSGGSFFHAGKILDSNTAAAAGMFQASIAT